MEIYLIILEKYFLISEMQIKGLYTDLYVLTFINTGVFYIVRYDNNSSFRKTACDVCVVKPL